MFVTHDQEEAFVLGDEVAVMLDGEIVQQSTPAGLYDEPATPWVASFVGDANLVAGRGRGHHADTGVGPVVLRAETEGPVQVVLRPEELRLGPSDDGGAPGVVELVEFYGHDCVTFARLDDGELIRGTGGVGAALRTRRSCRGCIRGRPRSRLPRGTRPHRRGARTSAHLQVILVVGAGPGGLLAAWHAARAGHEVTVVERAHAVGGLAGSFDVAGLRVDHGSHRLHPNIDPPLLAELRDLLGDDLQTRPRHGRIAMAGRMLAFPLRSLDLLRGLPGGLAARMARDAAVSPLRRPRADTFADVVRAGLGPTVYDTFYGPYAAQALGHRRQRARW